MLLNSFNTGDVGDDASQLINGDQPILAQIQWFVIVRVHQSMDACDTIIYVAERADLLAVSPDFDYGVASQLGHRNLTA